MDGMIDEDLSSQLPRLSSISSRCCPTRRSRFSPDGGPDGCDDIKERAPNGTVRTIVNSQTRARHDRPCHINNIQYSKEDDTLVFSDHITARSRRSKRSDRDDGLDPERRDQDLHRRHLAREAARHPHARPRRLPDLQQQQHGRCQQRGAPGGTGDGSVALEIKLDPTAKTVTRSGLTRRWERIPDRHHGRRPADAERQLRDRLLGRRASFKEVSPDGTLLQTWSWPLGGHFGYIQKRATLYGPPPR